MKHQSKIIVIPANAGIYIVFIIHCYFGEIPAFAGMTIIKKRQNSI